MNFKEQVSDNIHLRTQEYSGFDDYSSVLSGGNLSKASSPGSQGPEHGPGCLGFLLGELHRLLLEPNAGTVHFIPDQT